MKGRFIGENIRLIDSLITYTASKNIPGLLLFLDFEKAFDTLKWSFMRKVLGPVHTMLDKFEKATLLLRIRLPSTLIRIKRSTKTELFENALQSGTIWKRYFFVLVWTENFLYPQLLICQQQLRSSNFLFHNSEVTRVIQLICSGIKLLKKRIVPVPLV